MQDNIEPPSNNELGWQLAEGRQLYSFTVVLESPAEISNDWMETIARAAYDHLDCGKFCDPFVYVRSDEPRIDVSIAARSIQDAVQQLLAALDSSGLKVLHILADTN